MSGPLRNHRCDRTAVVIPSLNSARTLPATLDSLDMQVNRDALHVIVADNGSDDGSLQIARARADQVVSTAVRGIAAARNAGLARVESPVMLSIDSDCRALDGFWAERLLLALGTAGDNVIAAAGRSLAEPGGDRWSRRPELTPAPAWIGDQPAYAVSGNAAFRTDRLRDLGGFPLYGADDAALGMIARARGLRFVWVPDAVVFHRNPRGWRGYWRQMRKVGAYVAELQDPPDRPWRYWRDRGRHLASGGRQALRGEVAEASATFLRVTAQAMGARTVWRRGEGRSPLGMEHVGAPGSLASQDPAS